MLCSKKFDFNVILLVGLLTSCLFLFALYENIIVYKDLVVGIHSYETNQRFWEQILYVIKH